MLYRADSLFNENEFDKAASVYKELEGRSFIPKGVLYETIYQAYYRSGNADKAYEYAVKSIDLGRHYWYKGAFNYDSEIKNILTEKNDSSNIKKLNQQYLNFLNSDSICEWKALADTLNERKKLDQHYRTGGKKTEEEWSKQKKWDRSNRELLITILDSAQKWPGFKEVGKRGESAVFLIAQHSEDSLFQLRCLKMMKHQIHTENIYPSHYAMLLDRHFIQNYGYQIFGTQIEMIKNKAVPKTLWNKKYVDVLRLYFGMPPLDYYLKSMTEMNNKE